MLKKWRSNKSNFIKKWTDKYLIIKILANTKKAGKRGDFAIDLKPKLF
jgi:hypothetical protein